MRTIILKAFTMAALVSTLIFVTCGDGDKGTDTPPNYKLTTKVSPDSGGTVITEPTGPSYSAGTKVTLTAKPRPGYIFSGWQTGDADKMDTANPVAITMNKDTTAHAIFTQAYIITYKANDGTDTSAAQTKIHDVPLILYGAASTRTGYTFSDWNTQADGSGTAYAAGTSYAANAAITLYAQWKPDAYAVTFDSQDGSTVDSQTIEYGKKVAEPTAPTRANYTFDGWYKEAEYTTAWDFGEDVVTSAITLYAKWKLNTYAVTFDSQNGSAVEAQTIEHGKKVAEPTAPTRANYTFDGWYKEAEYTTAWNFDDVVVTSDITLYAKWTLNTYAVTFDSQSGSTVESQTVSHGGKVTEPTAPTRANYTFGGWYKEAANTNAWIFGDDIVTSAITLYAKWIPDTYLVTYNANGGTGSPTTDTKIYGITLTLSNDKPAQAGYAFLNWNTEQDGSGTTYLAGGNYENNVAVTLYAQWAVTYTVTYDANNGTDAPTPQTKIHDVALTLSNAAPTRTGYTFVDWNTQADGAGTTYGAGASYIDNAAVMLYAQWTINTYPVIYNSNGAGVSGMPDAQTKIYDIALTLSSTVPIRTGYMFSGWNTLANGSGTAYGTGASYTDNAAVTLYAQWVLIYAVVYDANGGTGAPDAQTKIHDVPLTLSSATPTRAGFVFSGWNTIGYGTGTAYNTEANYSANAAITLYAQWGLVYEGQTYKTVTIGTQTWMAENLNYVTASGSTCYANNDGNCAKYGRLYDWNAAMEACPVSWHLPSHTENMILKDYVGDYMTSGTKLKSSSYWDSYSGVPTGTDVYGFSALPSGHFMSSTSKFEFVGRYGYWWSATEYEYNNSTAWGWWLMNYNESWDWGNIYKVDLLSVRCVLD